MGIKKIGDRVRIFVAIKQLRSQSVYNRKQRNMVSQRQNDLFPIYLQWPRISWRLSKLQRVHHLILLVSPTVAHEA